MREQPPEDLISLVSELGIATPAAVQSVRGRVRRLARGLPAFASVWVDALAGERLLTPWQAAEINAGRGSALAVGPYVLCQPLASSGWARAYAARDRQSGQAVRLLAAPCSAAEGDQRAQRFERLLAGVAHVTCAGVALPTACGRDKRWLWCVQPALDGTTAALWCARRGRLAPEVVLEIARQMAAALAALARFELVHGDVATQTLVLQADGRIVLSDALFRAVARPGEGFSTLDVPPEALDYLAPERAREGRLPDASSDMNACGLVWWHLLTGRPPLAGGSSLAKLQAACSPRIAEVARLAPEAPAALAVAIGECLAVEPAARPRDFGALASRLGRPTAAGQRALATLLREGAAIRPAVTIGTPLRPDGAGRWGLAATGGVAVALAVLVLALPMTRFWPGGAEKTQAPRRAAPNVAEQKVPAEAELAEPAAVQTAEFTSGEGELSIDGQTVQLPAGGPVELERLMLRPGQIVRPPPGARTVCVVGDSGLVVEGDEVRFEDIDFVHGPGARRAAPLVVLGGLRARFAGCTFDGRLDERTVGAAIVWRRPREEAATTNAAGRLEMVDCIVRRAEHAVVVEHPLGAAIALRNCLQLGPGAVVRLAAMPSFEAPVAVALAQCTVREATGLIEIGQADAARSDGTLRIEFSQTVFALPGGTALVAVAGDHRAADLAQAIALRGDSSVVQPGVMLVARRDERGTLRPLRDDQISVQGLVRGAVEFGGPSRDGPTASRLTRWQVPLVAEEPPGIDASRLPDWTAVPKTSR